MILNHFVTASFFLCLKEWGSNKIPGVLLLLVLDCFLISIYNLKGKEKKDKHLKFGNQNVYPA